MYIGTITDKGLHHLVWEIVDNSVDECMAGYANYIKITICKDGYIEIEDNGRGIPVAKHPQTGLSTVETVLTVLHAGGKFDSDAYKVSGGLHGVGASVVNALSSDLHVWVKREGHTYYAHFQNGGQTVQPLTIINDIEPNETGTKIKFYPDFSILEKHPFSVEAITDHAKRIAYLTKGTRLVVVDEFNNTSEEFYYEGGLIDYVNELNEGQKLVQWFNNLCWRFVWFWQIRFKNYSWSCNAIHFNISTKNYNLYQQHSDNWRRDTWTRLFWCSFKTNKQLCIKK